MSGHVKVWKAYAEFEAAPIPMTAEMREEEGLEEDEERYVEGDVDMACQVLEKAYKDLKSRDSKDEVCHTSIESYRWLLIQTCSFCRTRKNSKSMAPLQTSRKSQRNSQGSPASSARTMILVTTLKNVRARSLLIVCVLD